MTSAPKSFIIKWTFRCLDDVAITTYKLTPSALSSQVSVFIEESTGKKSLPSDTQRTCSQYGEREQNKMNTDIKIREFCFQDFSDGVTVESHAHGPCGSAIEDHLAVRNISPPKLPSFRLIEWLQNLCNFPLILMSPLGNLGYRIMQVAVEIANFWATLSFNRIWIWIVMNGVRMTCSKLFARDTISSAIAWRH